MAYQQLTVGIIEYEQAVRASGCWWAWRGSQASHQQRRPLLMWKTNDGGNYCMNTMLATVQPRPHFVVIY